MKPESQHLHSDLRSFSGGQLSVLQ